jgi:hypothetical protein
VTESDRFQDCGQRQRMGQCARRPDGMFRGIAATIRALWRRWAMELRYRPERHYMRGGRRDGTAVANTAQGH